MSLWLLLTTRTKMLGISSFEEKAKFQKLEDHNITTEERYRWPQLKCVSNPFTNTLRYKSDVSRFKDTLSIVADIMGASPDMSAHKTGQKEKTLELLDHRLQYMSRRANPNE